VSRAVLIERHARDRRELWRFSHDPNFGRQAVYHNEARAAILHRHGGGKRPALLWTVILVSIFDQIATAKECMRASE
jgi:hypothetical protein